jgi:Predicted glutathione S-transferase
LGQLIDGTWHEKDLPRVNSGGEFERKQSDYRSYLGSGKYKAEAGRYHLFVNAGCPWAYRAILYRSIKNLIGTYYSVLFSACGWPKRMDLLRS